MHWSAGLPFLGMTVDKPLKIVYMQAEIGYFFLRERVREFYPELAENPLVRQNLVVSDKFHYCLNDEGKDEFVKRGLTAFKDTVPDMMTIDPLRNVFYSERDNATENDNTAMIEFLRDGVLDVQRRINPDMAIWLLHHLNKINTKALEDALFNAISGGGSLRGFYTVGVVAYHPDINMPEVKLCFELRNGPSIPPKLVVNKNGRWEELSPEERHLAERKQERKHKVVYDERREKIKEILHKEASDQSKLYVRASFASTFASKYGLGSQATISRALGEMLNDSTIKITTHGDKYNQGSTNSKIGYMVVEDKAREDEDTAPEPPDNPISRLGDVWICGKHKVLCGDSCKKSDYERLFGAEELADMCFTDPPYNVDYGKTEEVRSRANGAPKKGRSLLNDNLGAEFGKFLSDLCAVAIEYTKGALYICMAGSEMHNLRRSFEESGGYVSTQIVWAKNHYTLGWSDYHKQYEPILYGWRKDGDTCRDWQSVW